MKALLDCLKHNNFHNSNFKCIASDGCPTNTGNKIIITMELSMDSLLIMYIVIDKLVLCHNRNVSWESFWSKSNSGPKHNGGSQGK